MSEKEKNYSVADFEKAVQKARDDGFEVIDGDEWFLLLDFDNTLELPAQFIRGIEILNNNGFYCHVEDSWRSKSDTGFHVVVKLDSQPLDAVSRLALQAALGSDPVRELLGVLRTINGIKEPSVLFKPITKAEVSDG